MFLKCRLPAILFAIGCWATAAACNSEPIHSKAKGASGITDVDSMNRSLPPLNESHVAKVKVLANGIVLLDDKPISVDELRVAFVRVKENDGVVWYYREDTGGDPPPQATLVIQAIVDAKLPVRLSTKPDFSDSVSDS